MFFMSQYIVFWKDKTLLRINYSLESMLAQWKSDGT